MKAVIGPYTIDTDDSFYPIKSTKGGLWLVYGALAAAHGALLWKGRKSISSNLIHGPLTALCLYYPYQMQRDWLHADLHHFSYGALMLLFPYTPLQVAGGLLVFDEICSNNEIHLSKTKQLFPWKGAISEKEFDNDFIAAAKGTKDISKLAVSLPWILGGSALQGLSRQSFFPIDLSKPTNLGIMGLSAFFGLAALNDWRKKLYKNEEKKSE